MNRKEATKSGRAVLRWAAPFFACSLLGEGPSQPSLGNYQNRTAALAKVRAIPLS